MNAEHCAFPYEGAFKDIIHMATKNILLQTIPRGLPFVTRDYVVGPLTIQRLTNWPVVLGFESQEIWHQPSFPVRELPWTTSWISGWIEKYCVTLRTITILPLCTPYSQCLALGSFHEWSLGHDDSRHAIHELYQAVLLFYSSPVILLTLREPWACHQLVAYFINWPLECCFSSLMGLRYGYLKLPPFPSRTKQISLNCAATIIIICLCVPTAHDMNWPPFALSCPPVITPWTMCHRPLPPRRLQSKQRMLLR